MVRHAIPWNMEMMFQKYYHISQVDPSLFGQDLLVEIDPNQKSVVYVFWAEAILQMAIKPSKELRKPMCHFQ